MSAVGGMTIYKAKSVLQAQPLTYLRSRIETCFSNCSYVIESFSLFLSVYFSIFICLSVCLSIVVLI